MIHSSEVLNQTSVDVGIKNVDHKPNRKMINRFVFFWPNRQITNTGGKTIKCQILQLWLAASESLAYSEVFRETSMKSTSNIEALKLKVLYQFYINVII